MTADNGAFAEFSHTYAALPERFYARVPPTAVAAPALVAFNDGLASELGVDRSRLSDAQLAAICAGNHVPAGALPLAMAYAGHQFGSFVPQLGDGRALLIGEVSDAQGQRRDLQWKGAGPTPFSRRGDGRAALGPVLREYLVSEAMHALGLPTTRALSAVTTGERVLRDNGPLPGGVLIRVAASHVRIGTFEFFAARGDVDGVRTLADYAIARHYPQLRDRPDRYFALFEAVAERQSSLIARWMQIGFIHGVMNTDNMTVSGETIDFGPCAFMDEYDPATVYSFIDRRGRYAYVNQPSILQWNLARLAETLLPLIDADEGQAIERATTSLQGVAARCDRHWLEGFRRKLGLTVHEDGDPALVTDLLAVMHAEAADFTNTFRALADAAMDDAALPESFLAWTHRWRARLAREPGSVEDCVATMQRTNPACIPRNHRIEEIIEAAVQDGDFGPFHALHTVLARPFEPQPDHDKYRTPPLPHERVQNTFCGT
ncbi:MAG: YdiU family protein [Steroidobacteraceae bacterium]